MPSPPLQPALHTTAYPRIAQLAAQLPTHRAFHWLHLHQPQLLAWQLAFLAIPAPTFAEGPRAQWFLDRFRDLGLANPHIDPAGNALAELPAENQTPDSPILLLSAHLDTVFPPGILTTPTAPTPEDPRIHGPGSCDNGAGLTALLALAAALRFAAIIPPCTILFAANTGEEGEGDLRGIRHLLSDSLYAPRIATVLALEGSGTATAIDRALGSRRFRVTLTGPGGHSWTDALAPNPITLLARALAALPYPHPDPTQPRTTLSPGQITGGTSINSIPSSASVTLDLRSTDPTELDRLEQEIRAAFTQTLAAHPSTPPYSPAQLQFDTIGNRPAAALPPNSPLLDTLRAVDRHLALRTELRLGSTDANLPLSLGIPALALAAGGLGGGIHTLHEWYDPTAREVALRRILLTLLDTTQVLAQTL